MENTKKQTKKIICPYCGSRNVVLRGYRKNEQTKKHLRLCNSCRRKFTPDDGFLRMRYSKEDIIKAVKMHAQGASLSEVKRELKRKNIKVSRWTISKWTKKYAKKLRKLGN